MNSSGVPRYYRFYYLILRIYFALFYRLRGFNCEAVLPNKCIIAANHSSMVDPLAIVVTMKNSIGYSQTKFLAKSELAKLSFLKKIIGVFTIFINRGKSDMAAIKECIEHLKAGGNLVLFPEGTRVSEGAESQGKTGVIMMAMRSGAAILPTYVTEKKKNIFSGRIDVVFGEPYYPQKLSGEATSVAYHREAEELMKKIYSLRPDNGRKVEKI